MLLDIAVIPPKNIRSTIAQLTKKIDKKFGLRWRVDNRKLIPHITLFHLLADNSDLPDILSTTERLAKKVQPLNLHFGPIQMGHLAFGVNIIPTGNLQEMHEMAVANFNKFRSGVTYDKFPSPPKHLSALGKKYLKKYGMPGVMKNFRPHITLGMPQTPREIDQIISYTNRFKLPKFRADTLAVTKINQYFQVIEIIKTFRLL